MNAFQIINIALVIIGFVMVFVWSAVSSTINDVRRYSDNHHVREAQERDIKYRSHQYLGLAVIAFVIAAVGSAISSCT